MKRFFLFSLFLTFSFGNAFTLDVKEGNPNAVIQEMLKEIQATNKKYELLLNQKNLLKSQFNERLKNAVSTDQKVELLIQKDQIQEEIKILKFENGNDISKIRYLKGLQIIKILYEKVLSLDHHFASVRTLNEINKISNPNQYPEYSKLKEILNAKRDKKFAVDLTSMLGTNTIVSVVQTFTNMIGSTLTREEKESEIKNVECVLDFTLRMQNDLNTIYFETAYLQSGNDKIKQDIELLFKDYTKPIGYTSTLEICRTNDDWETITQKMDEYLAKVKTATGSSQYKMQVNMEFPIDRLLQFITQYNEFIDQGGKFYEKFKIILNSYENEKQCETKLPPEYKKLKADIDVAIQKFNIAYKPVEVNGTKMKEILYGLNEFE
ncbi:hypothetical protein FNO01nite_06160 [Flavobacterium noncentrifugens]|uniref:Uncharacterized protein n=1 Tax=Flavobacterium noncentrifugens TaxID=1128970 RepID=A0A1G8STH2_9FLAO|nr:hypothetical protein [Flavobacterium noncentrifugens]GEP49944.1 hypothetical protein FNO01nite_06160 [Flavobacterium noncentrifugens]SDJ32065.1 hypothetical protein SAMN04487935_0677 [Flavobacterium noncentrifugens]